MKEIEKKIYQILKKIDGNVLAIGLDDDNMLKLLEENNNIAECNLLNASSNQKGMKRKIKKQKKNFNIRQLRKKFHKKKVDYIICNMNDIYPYIKTFIKDSVYINRKKLYFYGDMKKYDLDKIISRYKKYGARIEQTFYNNYFLITILNEKSKTNKIKDSWFSLVDFMHFLYEIIGDLLIN